MRTIHGQRARMNHDDLSVVVRIAICNMRITRKSDRLGADASKTNKQ